MVVCVCTVVVLISMYLDLHVPSPLLYLTPLCCIGLFTTHYSVLSRVITWCVHLSSNSCILV